MATHNLPETQSELTRYLGLDIGGTKIKAGVVTSAGEVVAGHAVESHIGGSRDEVLADIRAALEPFRRDSAAGLGVGFPSFGDYERGVLDSELSGYPSMHGFPLRQHLEDEYGLPTKLLPDANLFAHGILRFGEGKLYRSFMAIALETRTAIGLVRDGEVLTGPRGFPKPTTRFYTAWGWPSAWGHSGLHFASHYGADPETSLQRAVRGDRLARDAFEQVGVALVDTITRLTDETQIRVAVIGGGLANAWAFIGPSLRARVELMPISVVKTELANPSRAGWRRCPVRRVRYPDGAAAAAGTGVSVSVSPSRRPPGGPGVTAQANTAVNQTRDPSAVVGCVQSGAMGGAAV